MFWKYFSQIIIEIFCDQDNIVNISIAHNYFLGKLCDQLYKTSSGTTTTTSRITRYYKTVRGTTSGTTRYYVVLWSSTSGTTSGTTYYYEVWQVVLQGTTRHYELHYKLLWRLRYYKRFKVLQVVLRVTTRYYEVSSWTYFQMQLFGDVVQNRCSRKFWNFLREKENPTHIFSCKCCKIFKNSFFLKHLHCLLLHFLKSN